MQDQEVSIFTTDDGSHSLIAKEGQLSYHSRHGAIQESQHVFIDAGLRHKSMASSSLTILEIGFGTGLNAFMSYLEATKSSLPIHYTTYELYPIDLATASQLNYPDQLEAPASASQFQQLHACEWSKETVFSDHFTFLKHQQSFLDIAAKAQYDIIYFDAFAPEAQPQLWEQAFLQKMYDALKPGGILTTYCAKGAVKRSLKAVGFRLEKLAGPPGKREMTRATVDH